MTAKLFPFPSDDQREFERSDNSREFARIKTVTRIADELYDEREEGTAGVHRRLETFEALFISAVIAIGRGYSKQMSDALKTWGDGAAYDAICNLSYRQQADDMENVLAIYHRERDRFNGDFDDSVEAVAEALNAAE